LRCKGEYIPRKLKKIKLGEYYILWWGTSNKVKICKFIKTTKLGYNFLNIDTNTCILKRPIYPSKKEEHSSGDVFWINEFLNIKSEKDL
jgi:hypothetical protein